MTDFFGSPRRHFPECASTNDQARAWAADAADPAPHGALVTADFQTQGRGRRGRSWAAARGRNALMSFVVRPTVPQTEAWQLGFVAALAVADALASSGLSSLLKWPNDVLLNGNKIAGVLVETASASASWFAVVGIGLNINQDVFPQDQTFLHPPTSLRLVTGREWAVEPVIQAVSANLKVRVREWQEQGFAPILSAWRQRLAVGAELRRPGEAGALLDVNEDGSACVRRNDGTFAQWTTVEREEGANRAQ